MKNQLQKIPAWHSEAAELLKQNFTGIHSAFLDATKKAVWLGIFLNAIKTRGKEDNSIPHGQFLPWIALHLPDVSPRAAQTYMEIGRNVCEKGKLEIRNYCVFEKGENRTFAAGELPATVLKLIEGKSQKELQLCLDLKQVDKDGKPKVGRRKGEGGATREQREAIKLIEHQEKLTALKVNSAVVAKWLMDNADTEGLGRADYLETGECKELREAIKYAIGFFKHQT